MELFQRAQNPWGQDVLVRISWNLFWLAVAAYCQTLGADEHILLGGDLNGHVGEERDGYEQ